METSLSGPPSEQGQSDLNKEVTFLLEYLLYTILIIQYCIKERMVS